MRKFEEPGSVFEDFRPKVTVRVPGRLKNLRNPYVCFLGMSCPSSRRRGKKKEVMAGREGDGPELREEQKRF